MTLYIASTQSEINAALLGMEGGDVLKIAPGSYDEIRMANFNTRWDGDKYRYSETVTVTALDATDPPVFRALELNGVRNVRIDGLAFRRDYAPDDDTLPFNVQSSKGVEILNSRFTGDVARGTGNPVHDGYPAGKGLVVRFNEDVRIEGNEISSFFDNLLFGHNTNGVVRGNNLHGMRNDAMDLFALVDCLIEGNWLHDNAGSPRSGDHRDMIQLWTTNTTRATDGLIVRGNLIDVGRGLETQSIFMRNEMVDTGQKGADYRYRNITIEENIIYNSHLNAIMVGNADGLAIRNNSVLHARIGGLYRDDPSFIPSIRVYDATGLVLERNIAPRISLTLPEGEAPTVADNLLLMRALYGRHFVGSTTDLDKSGANHWVPAEAGGILAGGLGAAAMRGDAEGSPDLRPTFDVRGEDLARVFDASRTPALSRIAEEEVAYLWDFGDGAVASGRTVAHAYRAGGHYKATLTVLTRDGRMEATTHAVEVAGREILAWSPAEGAFVAGAYGEDRLIRPAGLVLDGAGAIVMSDRVGHTVAGANADQWKNAEHYEVSVDFAIDRPGSSGTVAQIHTAFKFWTDTAGRARALVIDGAGTAHYLTPGTIRVDDGAVHTLALAYDAGDRRAVFRVDGQVMASATVTGLAEGLAGHSLVLGSAWNQTSIDGRITGFSFTAEKPPAATAGAGDGFTPAMARHRDLTGFILDIDRYTATGTVAADPDGASEGSVHLAGTRADFADLGRLFAFERSDRLGLSVEFERHRTTNSLERLVSNDGKWEIQLRNGGIDIYLATATGKYATLSTGDLGLDDAERHRVTALLDQETDRLQVIVDDALRLDIDEGVDFDLYAIRPWEGGWTLSSKWNAPFSGTVHDIRFGDDFAFVDPPPPAGLLT